MKWSRAALAIVFLLWAGIAGAACDPSYVHQNGTFISVLPTSSDDTANLQCAFDLGSGIAGVVIQLSRGTYTTGRIVPNGFNGTFRGMGMDATLIRNPDYPIYVTPDDFQNVLPESPDFAPPYLFAILGGSYNITDMTVAIHGTAPATDWSFFGIRYSLGHGIYSLAAAFKVIGSPGASGYREVDAKFERIRVTGESSNDPVFPRNVFNGVYYEAFAGPDLKPSKGRFAVTDSMFDMMGTGTSVDNVIDSQVTLSGNTYRNIASAGSMVADLKDTVYEFSHNKIFSGYAGVNISDDCFGGDALCGMSHSGLLIDNNAFRSTEGVSIDGTFLDESLALVLGNNFSQVSDIAVYLGKGTNHCTVVGTGKGTVVDLGSDNSVTGMTKVVGPQGQRIKSLLNMGMSH